jgi:ABC-2 type transport system ATP-binding protein
MTGAEPAIRIRGLCKNYGAAVAVADLDLTVGTGEVFGFLGPNGAGKSTTIRILLDLLRPTAGEVTVLGQRPRRDGRALRRRIGYLPGDFVIYTRQSVLDALTGLGRLRGGVERGRIDGLCERLELDPHRRVSELSKGNRQKVGLVQAFMHEPELLILDEPTDGLDPLLRKEFAAMVAEVRAAGRTVFLSSHILSEVQTSADRVAMIRAGRLVAVDTVESLRERAVRRVQVEFGDKVPASEFDDLPFLENVTFESTTAGSTLHCHLTGSADALVKAIARHPVSTLSVEEPDLEEVFLTLYSGASPSERSPNERSPSERSPSETPSQGTLCHVTVNEGRDRVSG